MILLRDDDPNATTRPERLARVYAPLLDAGYPVNFAVVPEVALDTLAPDGRRERFIDEDAPRSSATVPLMPDSDLAVWLKANASQIDVFQHGHTHRRGADGTEFGGISRNAAARAIEQGATVLERALGRRPVGFVPPWDVPSRGAVEAAASAFPLISCRWVNRARLPYSAWPAHVVERATRREAMRVGDSWLLRHRNGINADVDPAAVPAIVDALTRGTHVGVIVLHHWMFWERSEPHPVIVALARALRGKRLATVREAVAHLETCPRWFGRARTEHVSGLRRAASSLQSRA
jgi:hypothetical protein